MFFVIKDLEEVLYSRVPTQRMCHSPFNHTGSSLLTEIAPAHPDRKQFSIGPGTTNCYIFDFR